MNLKKEFFAIEHNLKTIKNALKQLNALDFDDQVHKAIQQNIGTFFRYLISSPDFYDANCINNIEWIGQSFINDLEKFNQLKEVDIEKSIQFLIDNFCPVYRFLLEAKFNHKGELNHELNSVIRSLDRLSQDATISNEEMHWARYLMPADIVNTLIHHENLQDVKTFNENVDKIEQMRIDWDDELNKKRSEVDNLSNKLQNFKTAFNFVGLYQGFNSLSDTKKEELCWARLVLIAIGALTVFPVALELYLLIFKTTDVIKYKELLVYAIFPTLTLQFIFIYFFRVTLLNFKSIKAQILQIELRKTLCQFIQNYTDYAKEMKSNDSTSLEKFESLIFSGLITNEENLPSTFDGIEQLGKIIQSLKPTS